MESQNKQKIEIRGNCDFPSQNAPYSEKESKEYGIAVARSIQSMWFFRFNGAQCRFYTSQAEKRLRRAYSKGIQPMAKYYRQLGANGDKSYLNLPKRPVTSIPKYEAMVCNGFAERDYSIRATAVDEISQNNRFSYRRQLEDDMLAQPIIQKAGQELGVNIANVPQDQLPETNEELELHMQLEYKPSIELSAELAIDYIFQDNKYKETTERQVRKDLFSLGEAWGRHRFVPERGVVLEYVNPEYKIQSYSEDPYFRDCFWHGEFKQVLMSDVMVEFPFLAAPEYADIREKMLWSGDNWYTYHNIPPADQLKGTTNLLYFTYKTTRERKSKLVKTEMGGVEVAPYSDSQNEKRDYRKYKKLNVIEEIEFEGVYVLGTDILLKWEVAECMIRPKSNKQKLIGQYIGVAPNRDKEYIDSMTRRMMDTDDDIQMNRLKIFQMVQRMIPDGYNFDFDGLADIDLGDGSLKVQELMDMLFQTGSTVSRSYTASGDMSAAKIPITELRNGGNIQKIAVLLSYQASLQAQMREVIGITSVETPEKDALVGIQKLMVANSNVATRDILHGVNWITEQLAIAGFYRLTDLLKYSELKDDLARQIGATAVTDIDEIKDLHLSDFAIYLSLELDDDEKAALDLDLSKAVDKGYIGVEDKYKILGIKNLKQAISYLTILVKKRQKREQEAKKQEIDYQTQANLQSAQGAEEQKRQTAQIIGQMNLQEINATNMGMIQKVQAEGEQNRMTEQVKGNYQLQAAGITAGAQMEKLERQESAKDSRSAQEAEQQSILAVEKAKEKPNAVDFEALEQEKQMFQA